MSAYPELRERDLHGALEFVGRIGTVPDLAAFRSEALAGLRRLVPSEIASYNEVDLRRRRAVAVVDPGDSLIPDGAELLAQLGRQNPLLTHYAAAPDARALKLSEFIGRRAFHRTDVYDLLYRPAAIEHQLAFVFPSPSWLVIGVALNSARRDFSERDRQMLELMRPHLLGAYAQAQARTWARLELDALMEAAGSAGRSIVMLDRVGQIAEAHPLARELLNAYFGNAVGSDRLPPIVEDWMEGQRSQLWGERRARTSTGPLVANGSEGRLTVWLLAAAASDEPDLLILEHARRTTPASLRQLGLTKRESEVLWHVAEGSGNAEIARQLGVSSRTVEKHLERIYARLGVTNRTAASARAREARDHADDD